MGCCSDAAYNAFGIKKNKWTCATQKKFSGREVLQDLPRHGASKVEGGA